MHNHDKHIILKGKTTTTTTEHVMERNGLTNPVIVTIEDDDQSAVIDDDTSDDYHKHQTGPRLASLTSGSSTTSTSTKRQKDISPCYVCGAKAHGYNFDQITCESCKAFFRRNALKSIDKFRCRGTGGCVITSTTRKRCKRCRLSKCFKVGMRKEWILTEEEKTLKRTKIERNRLMKKQPPIGPHAKHQSMKEMVRAGLPVNTSSSASSRGLLSSSTSSRHLSRKLSDSAALPLPLMCMYSPSDRHMYDRHHGLLKQLSAGYRFISEQYPQPNKFLHRNVFIGQTSDMDSKLLLVKDLTRELTQMTTSRLLHFFSLIPEFQLLSDSEKQSILIRNMLTVFMFHGALTYDADNDTFVDQTTADQPYDAKYLLLVYGPRVYENFIVLARALTSATYQSSPEKGSDERAHNLFLLLMVILLFSDGFDSEFELASAGHEAPFEVESNKSFTNRSLSNTTSESISSPSSSSSLATTSPVSPSSKLNEKLHKIQQNYVEIACRYLQDEVGLAVGRQMFHDLVPLLFNLQKLCSTLANVNLCELAEDEDRTSMSMSSRAISTSTMASIDAEPHSPHPSPPTFSSNMISGTSHFNELQKENRAPPPSSTSSATRSVLGTPSVSPSVLSNTITPLENNQR